MSVGPGGEGHRGSGTGVDGVRIEGTLTLKTSLGGGHVEEEYID